MLLWTALVCLLSANFAVSQFAVPGVLVESGPALQPLKDSLQNMDSSDNLHVIRGLLRARQSCPAGYGECSNPAGRCCPAGSMCCTTTGCCRAGYFCYSTGCCPTGSSGCEGNSCCIPGETCCTGGGCCQPGYNCAVVNGERGCCPVGQTCTTNSDTPQCATPGYVVCTGETFCCPPSYTCYRDSAGNPKCTLANNSIPPTLTKTNTDGPTGTFIGSPSSSSTPKGPSTAVLPRTTTTSSTSSPQPTPSSNNNSPNGLTSSALSVVFDSVLTWFAGVGVFAYLF